FEFGVEFLAVLAELVVAGVAEGEHREMQVAQSKGFAGGEATVEILRLRRRFAVAPGADDGEEETGVLEEIQTGVAQIDRLAKIETLLPQVADGVFGEILGVPCFGGVNNFDAHDALKM